MKKTLILLALIPLTAQMYLLGPSRAVAGEPVIDPASGKFPLAFTSAGGASDLVAAGEPTIECASNKGTGKYTSATTGEISLTFGNCIDGTFRLQCHSPGQLSGVIKFGSSIFHNVYVVDSKSFPGILTTPPAGGLFTTIECAFGFSNIEVRGNGLIGSMTAAACGKSSAFELAYTVSGTSQTYKQNTQTGTAYDLVMVTEGGSSQTAAEIANRTLTLAESATLTCS